jgi:hypothetical protein
MNSCVTEALRRRQIHQAYWWARAAIETDQEFRYSYSTLGVIHMRSPHWLSPCNLIGKQPFPPFHFFQLGINEMNRRDFEEAKSLFKRELIRAPDYHEFHFWLGLA